MSFGTRSATSVLFLLPLLTLCLFSDTARPAVPRSPPATLEEAHERVSRSLIMGRWRVALEAVETALEQWPGDPDLLLMLGVLASRLDDHAMARVLLGDEPLVHEALDIDTTRPLADALRLAGRGAEAATLRQTLLVEPTIDTREQALWLSVAEDWRVAGRLEEAEDAAMVAYALGPYNARVQAMLATLATDRGDLDEAWFHQMQAARQPSRRHEVSTVLSAMRLALAEGAPDEALAFLQPIMHRVAFIPEVAALRAEAHRQAGEPEEALQAVDRSILTTWGEARHPAVQAQLVLALAALARRDEAKAILETARRSSDHPALLRAEAIFEGQEDPGLPGAL